MRRGLEYKHFWMYHTLRTQGFLRTAFLAWYTIIFGSTWLGCLHLERDYLWAHLAGLPPLGEREVVKLVSFVPRRF